MRTLARKIGSVEKALGERLLRAPWRMDPEQWTLRFMTASPVHQSLLERADAFGLARHTGISPEYRACRNIHRAFHWLGPSTAFLNNRVGGRVVHPQPDQVEAAALMLAIIMTATAYAQRHRDPYFLHQGSPLFSGRPARRERFGPTDFSNAEWIRAQPWCVALCARMDALLKEPAP